MKRKLSWADAVVVLGMVAAVAGVAMLSVPIAFMLGGLGVLLVGAAWSVAH